MNCLIAENQRHAILAALPPAGRMLEWGCGGSTLWFLQRLKPEQQLITVEHDAAWLHPVIERVSGGALNVPSNWMPLHLPPMGSDGSVDIADAAGAAGAGRVGGIGGVGANATPLEECPAHLTRYIDPTWLGDIDVFLIDGVARGACLANIFMHGRAGARVFLHDAARSWYDWALRLGKERIAEARVTAAGEGDYPPAMWECVLK